MHRVKFSAFAILPLLAFVCLSDTAAGQTIALQENGSNVTSVTFTVPANTPHTSPAAQQTLTVLPSTGPTTLLVTQGNQGQFIYVNGSNTPILLNNVPSAASGGGTFILAVDTTGLSPNTTYSSYFTVCYTTNSSICAPGATGNQITITLNVTSGSGSTGTMSASPNPLPAFSAVAGSSSTSPTSQNLQILNSVASLSYTLTATTTSGGQWLLVNGVTSTSGVENGAAIPVSISTTVLPTLAAGSYTGTLTAVDSAGNQVTVTVTLNVSQGNIVTASPTAFQFLYQIGQATPAAQTLAVMTNSSTAIGFSIAMNPSVSWLLLSSFSGSTVAGTPYDISLSVNSPNQLSAGNYSTNLIITPFGQAALPAIPVTLAVSTHPLLQLSQSSLSFNAAFAGQSPSSQNVNVTTTGSGGSVGFTATVSSNATSWLSVTSSASSTPATLTVSVNSGSLAVGNYTGTITVAPTNGDTYTEPITVSLTVSSAAQLTVGPPTLLFSYETTQAVPGPQNIAVVSSGQNTTFTYAVSTTPGTNCAGNTWLSVSAFSGTTTPAELQISVAAAGMTAGTCIGNVAITAAGSSTPVNVPVYVAVSTNTPILTIQAEPPNSGVFGVFTMQQGGSAPNQQFLQLGSTGVPVNFSVGYTSTPSWLFTSFAGTGGTTPYSLGINVSPGGLSAGTYGGTLTIASTSLPSSGLNGQFSIPITLVVTPNVTVTETPSTMSFSFTANGSIPMSQNITLTSTGGTASYTASITSLATCPSGILGLSPTSGTANGTIAVSIESTSFTAGTYNCQIAISYVNASTAAVTIPVTITVAPAISVTASPSTLAFTYTIGSGMQPPSQAITVSSMGGSVQFTVGTTTTSGGNWLSVGTTTGTTSGSGTTLTATVNVSVSTNGLSGTAAGTVYNGSVTISSPGVLATPITIAVTLTVIQPPSPSVSYAVNSASGVAGVIAPGELLSIYGTLMGPSTGVNFSPSQGTASSTLSGVQVTFNGIAGTPTYVSATQINVVAPWEISGQPTVNIVVTYNGNSSTAFAVRVADFAPAIYTQNAKGTGPAAALNQNGTYNGPPGGQYAPAPAGTVVVLYGTGCGVTSPPGTDGSVSPLNQLLYVTAPVGVTFGSPNNPLVGKVLFIGAAPGLITGVCQINVQTPSNLPSGNQFVTLTVGGISSPEGPTIAIQ